MNTAMVTYRKRKLNGRMNKSVQDPTCAQSFNKYAYCMNNPLRYVDPSGWQMVGGSTPKHYDWRDKEVPYEPRDYREGSSYMMNCNLHGASLYSGGCFSTSSYGYVAAHPQYSVEQQFALLRNWRDNPSTLNKMLMWNAGLSDINFGESYCNGIRNTHLSWECDGVAHTADIYGEYVGGTGCYVQVLSDLGGSGSYMPPGYNYSSSDNTGCEPLCNNESKTPVLQLVTSGSYVFDGHFKTAPGIYSFEAGQHVKVVVRNQNVLGVTLSLEDQSTYTYSGWLRGKQYTGDSYSFAIPPFCSRSFDFYRFKSCPISWQFGLETEFSDAACVSIEFYSEWIPGRP